MLIPLASCITQRKSPPRLDARPPTSVHVPMPAPTTLAELIALYLARCRIEGLYLFDKPLLLVGEDGANLVNRSTPIAFIARGKYRVNNHAHVLDGLSEQYLRYLELFINATDLLPFVTGTAQPKMNKTRMNSIPVALPPLAEQYRIVARVDELTALCDRLEAALRAADATRSRLLETLLREAIAAAA